MKLKTTWRKKAEANQGARPAETGWLERWFLAGWRPYIWIVLLGVLIYGQVLTFGLTELDDAHLTVINYQHISRLDNIPLAFRSDVYWKPSGIYYRPLLTLSFMVDAQLYGTKVWGYHLTNLLLHLACVCLLFIMLSHLGIIRSAAFASCMIFACHPLLRQAVCWIPGRNDTLLTLYILAGFIALIRYTRTGRWRWLATHLGCGLAAMLTKEVALFFPVVIAVFMIVAADWRPRLRGLVILVAGWAAIIAIYFIFRSSIISNGVSDVLNRLPGPIGALLGLSSYLSKILFPINLSVLPILENITPWPGLLAAVIVMGVIISRGSASPRLAIFAVFWFLLFLAPTLIKSSIQFNFMEHRAYLPLVGLLVLLLNARAFVSLPRKAAVGLTALIVFALSTITAFSCKQFAGPLPFWENAVSTAPHSILGWRCLGQRYYEAGDKQKSE